MKRDSDGAKFFRRTKIVATLGPASSSLEQIKTLVEAGVDVFRINSSHGTAAERVALIERVVEVRKTKRRPIAILVDLQGPRIRVGRLTAPRELVDGQDVVFAPESEATDDELPMTYHQLAHDVSAGDRILLDDGLLEVTVTAVTGRRVKAKVKHGGELKSHKGMNLPGVRLSVPAITEKDKEDIRLTSEHEVDFIGLSFISRPEEIWAARALVPPKVRLVSKIELATALDDLHRIVEATDVIMVARGDLGVELPFEEVPLAQKQVIELANRLGRPVITATQMLESMIENPRPTRAEASDVANAVLDGTDAVMLSAETAVGEHAAGAVSAMDRIIRHIELAAGSGWSPRRRRSDRVFAEDHPSVAEAIAVATVTAADMLGLSLIVCFTSSGFTARQLAAARPNTPIVAITPEVSTFRQLALTWGVFAVLADHEPTYERMLDVSRDAIASLKFAEPGDQVVVTAGVPFDVPGTTNLIKVEVV